MVDDGYYAQENDGLREIVTAFEQEAGEEVELGRVPVG
jgi:hypothetical protein